MGAVALFQPTRPHGARLHQPAYHTRSTKFQPTRPHGARHSQGKDRTGYRSFNPRARMGRDL